MHDPAEQVVVVMVPVDASGPQGVVVADAEDHIRPGGMFGSLTYDDLVRMGNGEHEIPDPPVRL